MKVVIAFLAGIAVAQALVTCPDKEFQCPDGDTCCQLKGSQSQIGSIKLLDMGLLALDAKHPHATFQN